MCELCDLYPDGQAYCPECGRMMCYDWEQVGDMTAPASATAGGDLACLVCAVRSERQEEYQAQLDALEWGELWEDYPGELIAGELEGLGRAYDG